MLSLNFELTPGKKIYFASDFHLGAPDKITSFEREKKICHWLESIKEDAEIIFLLGDLFDFWFEFGNVIPKGFSRLQGKLAELTDFGIKIIILPGNHDMWMFSYFTEELGIAIYKKPLSFNVNGKRFLVAHGDALGPGDLGYKFLNKFFFRNRLLQFLFRWFMPNTGMWLGRTWARASFNYNDKNNEVFYGDKEWLISYSKSIENMDHHDFYVYGHRHFSYNIPISDKSSCINLGEWITGSSYAVFDGREFSMAEYN